MTSKQIIIGNCESEGSKGTFEKYHAEYTILESTPRFVIEHRSNESDVTLQGNFVATAFHARSDGRLKENINDLQNSLEIVKKLDGKEYNFKDRSRKSYGFIAQEIEQILPDIVDNDKNGIKSISYGDIIPILSNAIKELNNKIDLLENKISK
jgi:hypothetical protein